MPTHDPTDPPEPVNLHIVSGPNSRLTVNGKNCEDWYVWTENFIGLMDLSMDEAHVMMLNMVAIQCALHDHETNSPGTYNFGAQLFHKLYVEAREACAAGHLEKTHQLSKGGTN